MRVLLAWSGGKDSALALQRLRERDDVEVAGLLSTLDERRDVIAMHGTPRPLLEAQAAAAGLPLHMVSLPFPSSNEVYEAAMGEACRRAQADGVEAVAFGDLFLEDIRRYREERMAATGMKTLFPLWSEAARSPALAREIIDLGIVAHLVCVDPQRMPPESLGARFDLALLEALPAEVDPMGERGEFHTFVSGSPDFGRRLQIAFGAVSEHDGFLYRALSETIQD